ncbi:uncharacterized protein H6S33_008833 [Morchella sextelata]|jgi:hypothetical protein|uniref:uncharacterized protein n=1 Tax=Morchella sextelata TaxID=1174677 RepID=UPI001D03831C|nr:uncharacterized protein H6S33_008833 [Morchella sextelata]KAH0602358.1 hypothetical protein H6S33_008833 [Morchella sextelata]
MKKLDNFKSAAIYVKAGYQEKQIIRENLPWVLGSLGGKSGGYIAERIILTVKAMLAEE